MLALVALFAGCSHVRSSVLASIPTPLTSSAGDDHAFLNARCKVLREEDSRGLAAKLRDNIHDRLHFLYEPVWRCNSLAVQDEMGYAEKKMSRKEKQVVMVHVAAVSE